MSKPLSKLVDFFRIQMSGAPVEHVEAAVAGIEKHVVEEIDAAERRIEADLTTWKADVLAEVDRRLAEVGLERTVAPTPAAPPAADPAAEAPASEAPAAA